jgi:hypothetical protein
VHNPLNAWRAKTRPGEAAQGQDSQAGRAPVAEAVKTAGSALNRAEHRRWSSAGERRPAVELLPAARPQRPDRVPGASAARRRGRERRRGRPRRRRAAVSLAAASLRAVATRLAGDLQRTREALAVLSDSEQLEAELATVRADTQAEISHAAQQEAIARRDRMQADTAAIASLEAAATKAAGSPAIRARRSKDT